MSSSTPRTPGHHDAPQAQPPVPGDASAHEQHAERGAQGFQALQRACDAFYRLCEEFTRDRVQRFSVGGRRYEIRATTYENERAIHLIRSTQITFQELPNGPVIAVIRIKHNVQTRGCSYEGETPQETQKTVDVYRVLRGDLQVEDPDEATRLVEGAVGILRRYDNCALFHDCADFVRRVVDVLLRRAR